MRAKIVKETLYEFHKTGDPLSSLGVGPYAYAVQEFFDNLDISREDYKIEGNKTIFESLNLSHNINIVELPENLYINQYLNLSGCIELTKLPNNLHVEWSLNLENCHKLIELPEDLFVGTNIYVKENQKKLIRFIRNSKFGHIISIEKNIPFKFKW